MDVHDRMDQAMSAVRCGMSDVSLPLRSCGMGSLAIPLRKRTAIGDSRGLALSDALLGKLADHTILAQLL